MGRHIGGQANGQTNVQVAESQIEQLDQSVRKLIQ